MKTAQMFIVTAVFLVSLIFTVQNLVFNYSFIDFQETFRDNDYVFTNIKNNIQYILDNSKDCESAKDNAGELFSLLGQQMVSGYVFDFDYKLNCTNWKNTPPNPCPLKVRLKMVKMVKGKKSVESEGMFCFYRNS